MSLAPTSALVAVEWIRQHVVGVAAGQVATKLPRDVAAWIDRRFVQVTIIPAGADPDGNARMPYAQIDAWAASSNPGTTAPPVGRAADLAELVYGYAAARDGQPYGAAVTLPAGYDDARVLSVWPTTEPSEVADDPSGYARVTFDLALVWARI